MYRIMIVEDDPALCSQMAEVLRKWRFETVVVENFDGILADFVNARPHLVIMDVNLPCYDGFYWCGRIRELSKVPIVFVSSRDTNMDIIMAVNMGGDDYITKPFSIDILIAKLNALLRRAYAYGEEQSELVECGSVILNTTENFLVYGEEKLELTRNEFKIIMLLMKNKGKVITRERIMRALWEDDSFINDNTLTVNINRLRSRLEDIGLRDFIATRKGQGYLIE